MSMGEIGNVDEFKEIHELKVKMLEQFGDIITDDEFMVSMGTSQDYEQAIIHGGSNQVRLGTTIFGARDYSKKK